MKRRPFLKSSLAASALIVSGLFPLSLQAAETIKVGVLHSLSDTMAISETSLKDMALMTIDEINAKGGVLGKQLEPVVVDPASNWPLFAEKGRQLLTQDKVAVTFGCWTSVSRKSVLPVYEELNGLLFYPVQYEGEELSPSVFYTGAAPNQQAIPAVEYLMSEDGGAAKRYFLLGTDYVYPRTTNKILRSFLHSKGVADQDIEEVYTPLRSQRLSNHRRRHQEVLGWRLDRGDLHGQRRLQRAVLQGTGQPGHRRHRRAGGGLLGWRGRTARHRHQAPGRPARRVELLPVGGKPGQ
jgi:urea transport system substrate-binding protein